MQQLCEQLPEAATPDPPAARSGSRSRTGSWTPGRRPAEILRLPLGLPDPRPRRRGRAHLRQPQAGPARAPAADQPGHRRSDHRSAAAGPGTLPRHPARRAGPAPRPRTPTPPAPSRSAAACSTCATATGSTGCRSCAAPTGTEFDRAKIVPYAYRHTYAQRHADAGIAVDVLSQLLDHRTLEVTRRYYRVGKQRRRAAVDTVTAHSFDRHGHRLWRDAHTLLDSEHARYAVGDSAVLGCWRAGRAHQRCGPDAGGRPRRGACRTRAVPARTAGSPPRPTAAAWAWS